MASLDTKSTELEKEDREVVENQSFSEKRSELRKLASIGESLRKSLQNCDVKNNLDKLEGLLKMSKKNAKLSKVLEGLLYVLRQLLASRFDGESSIGFLSFDDAYDLFCGFMETKPEKTYFRDQVLDKDHGLCVYIGTFCNKQYIILQNETTDIGRFLLELQRIEDLERSEYKPVRFLLDAHSLSKILSSMDTEYDKMALKAVIFASHSRAETYNLGIDPTRAVQFLSKVVAASEESERVLDAAKDIYKLRTRDRISKVEDQIQVIDQKIKKQGALLSQKRLLDLEGERDALKERVEGLSKTLDHIEDQETSRKVKQATKRIAHDLLESNRVKRRRLGAGPPCLLDAEDEDFIAKAVESKSTCHGRRHETTLFTHHRVKKRHFLSLAQYSLLKRGKKLIKSATTVTNRGKPRNVRSKQAKAHKHGKWLWCAKKPPKTEAHDTESTHHQRAHIRNAKFTMFDNDQKQHSVFISMGDKAYLRPGTDVGSRVSKTGVIYDMSDSSKRRQLPQHDFNEPKVNQTPASFRVIKGSIEHKQEEDILINTCDQTLVTIRPKYYIGSSGSVWASDYMRLCHEQPELFQEPRSCAHSVPLRRLSAYLHDVAYYFYDLTMEEDVTNASSDPECNHRLYEVQKLHWLVKQSEEAIQAWLEEEINVSESEKEIGNELKEKTVHIQMKAKCCVENCLQLIVDSKLYEKEEEVSNLCKDLCRTIQRFQLTPWCCDVLKPTDAGPGVGISNLEVRFRDIEIARIHSSDRVNRIHRAPGDSGQNEAERSNAAIGDALVDGSALKWNYYEPLDGLTDDEVNNLSVTDLQKRESDCMEKNAWKVAEEVSKIIDDEPGPAGDYIKSYVTTKQEKQFFFNTKYLLQYTSTKSDANRATVPGNAYFSKIEKFTQSHSESGEMYMEFVKGSCGKEAGERCGFCASNDYCGSADITRIPKPYPDSLKPGLHYRAAKDTPTVGRSLDDFHPRVHLKAAFRENNSYFDNPDNIRKFSEKFVVTESAIKIYVNHMKLLSLRKEKRSKEKAEEREKEARKEYKDYDWEGMFHERSLSKLKVAELDKYIAHHNLGKFRTKMANLEAIKEHIIKELSKKQIVCREDESLCESASSDEGDSDEGDFVLEEIGSSSTEEEEELSEREMTQSTESFNVSTEIVYTRSGRKATRIQF